MKKSWIILLGLIILMIVLISLVSGEESINLDYPKNVIVGVVFEINLTLIDFKEDIYDVKIDIFNESLPNLARRNWMDGWLLNRWMDNHTNISEGNSNIIQLNITKEFNGTANITIKIRNGEEDWIFEGYQINITPAQSQDPPNNNDDTNDEIYLDVEWDEEEIINGKEFEIKVKAYNLLDENYNLKIWIKFNDNDTKISERYDEENNEWKSGNYYVDGFFSGEGDKTKSIDLRINEDYRDYYGDDVEICFKLEDNLESEECNSIEILEQEESKGDEVGTWVQDEVTTSISTSTPTIIGNVIKLGSSPNSEAEDLKEQNNIIYQSKTELIKKYAIFAFAFFCVGLSVLLAFHKFK